MTENTYGPALSHPSDEDLRALLTARDLCVSILMNTEPASAMTAPDRHTLAGLADRAAARLLAHPDAGAAEQVTQRLRSVVADSAHAPTDRALAVLVSPGGSHVFQLPQSVEERVVVDPTFATRDLVVAVQMNPPHLLLHIDSRSARLYRHNQKYLQPVLSADFPMLRPGRVRADRDHEGLRAFLRRVHAGLSRQLTEEALPVVLVGGERITGEYLRVSTSPQHIVGVRRFIHPRPRLAELEQIGRDAIRDHVEDLRAAALDTLEARHRADRTVSGLLGAWHATAVDTPELLLVEQGFGMPAKVVAEGRYVQPLEDLALGAFIDDAVDDLMENVMLAGGTVAVVPDGTLSKHGRVALTLAR